MESSKRYVVAPMGDPQPGQVGASLVIVMLLASAVVSWSVAAMTEHDESPTGAVAPVAAVNEEKLESHDPANAEPFDGPKHKPYDAALQAASSSTEHHVTLEATEGTFEVADGIFMNLWTFGGSVPGPVIRVTQGDTIHFKLVNKASTAHSMDFHASEVAPNRAYVDVAPGKSFEFDWEARHPGVFMYHCGTEPVLHHVGNGMYGMVIVEPVNQTLAPAREYALVQSELYFGGQDEVGDVTKMEAKDADWIVFNGYANQYVDHPLVADPGERVRVYLLNAGPSQWSAFHVIGTVFDRTWQEGVKGGPAQTVSIAPSQGAIVEFSMEDEGTYPFISHALADADRGAVGTFKVGHGGPASSGGH
jgi:nitrite reductase (NO-forming)